MSRRPAPIPDENLRLAGSCVMSGWYGHGALSADVRDLLRRGALGGLLVSRHNFRDGRAGLAQVCTLIRGTCADAHPPLIAADQEGGPVAHISPPLPDYPSMPQLGAIDDTELTYRVGAALGHELREVGVTMDLAPVLDVRTSPSNLVVLNRTFSRDPQKVARHGRAIIEGLQSAGVAACAKHFPGHGATTADSHATLPRLDRNLADLDSLDLIPFREVSRVTSAVMLAHVVYTGIDPQNPATLSRAVATGVLRDHLAFSGVSITDDLQMAAITRHHPVEEAAEMSILAGTDMVLIAHSAGVARRVVHHLARRSQQDATLRARLEESGQRLTTLRAQLAAPPIPPNPFRESSARVLREVATRLAARPSRTPSSRGRDPTLRR